MPENSALATIEIQLGVGDICVKLPLQIVAYINILNLGNRYIVHVSKSFEAKMKSIIKLLVSFAFLSHALVHAQETETQVNPYGQFLYGDGVEVELAQLSRKNQDGLYDVLLKISGRQAYNAGIDGKVILYQAVHGGTGIDYKTKGKTRLIVRNPYGDSWGLMEVFLNGKTILVYENSNKSKEVRPLHLYTEYSEKTAKTEQ